MQINTKRVLRAFDEYFSPTEISVAEMMASRFIAGEDIRYIAADYGKPESAVIAALRFFFLHAKRNQTVKAVYGNYRIRKVGVTTTSTQTSDTGADQSANDTK